VEDPYIVTDGSELTVSFAASKRVRLSAQLGHITAEEATEDCSEYVLQQAESIHRIKFSVRLPKPGSYKLQASLCCILLGC